MLIYPSNLLPAGIRKISEADIIHERRRKKTESEISNNIPSINERKKSKLQGHIPKALTH